MERELKGAVRNRVKSPGDRRSGKANDIDVPSLIDSKIDVLRRRAAAAFGVARSRIWSCRAAVRRTG